MTATRIRELNDRFRCLRQGNGRLMVTSGINALGPAIVAEVICAVRGFTDFTAGNDPHGEHDFGALTVRDHRVLWKLDYYDPTLTAGSQDPTDEAKTCRVLTIMLAEEY